MSLTRALGLLHRAEKLLCCGAFAVMASSLMLDLVLREITGNGLYWSTQLSVYANIVVVMFGIGLASASGSHLRPRFADRLLPVRWEGAIVRCADSVTALALLLFALIASQLLQETMQLNELSTVLRIPIWPMQSLIPIAFFLAALRHGCYAWAPALRPAGA